MCSKADPHSISDDDDSDHNPLDINVLTRTLSIHHSKNNENKDLRCCCEQQNCPSFIQSKSVLSELEKDVQTAASLGKALLKRHELSLQDAAIERKRLMSVMYALEEKAKDLEVENRELQEESSKTIDENRKLLQELEQLNSGINESDIRAKELQEDLEAVHAELSRVSTAAARAEILEAQLSALENEQIELRKVLTTTKEGERAAVLRWKKAERSLSEMREEVERIEREHRMEKARAQNLLDRLEKRQIADRQNGMPSALVERTAMSQFMKEILAENNHLQSGISELRDMLIVSQEEVCALREQLMLGGKMDLDDKSTPLSRELLSERLTALGLPAVAPELHFHHHYHKEKPGARRMKKVRRSVALPDQFGHVRKKSLEGQVTPMSPGQISRPQRWSQLLSHTRSSSGRVPSYSSSPQSTFTWRDSMIFDRNQEPDSTRPSTPDSEYDIAQTPMKSSGGRYSRHRQQDSINPPFSMLYTAEEIPENLDEDGDSSANLHNNQNAPFVHPPSSSARSMLHRSASHESLLSPASALDSPNRPFPISPAMASFAPTSPLGIPSTSPNSVFASHHRNSSQNQPGSGASSVAYNHLLLAGGAIRGRSPRASTSTAGSKAGWLWGWAPSIALGRGGDGSQYGSGGSSPAKSTTTTVDNSALNTGPGTTPTASSMGGFGSFPKKKSKAEGALTVGAAVPSSAAVSITTSTASSIKENTGGIVKSPNSTVQPIPYRSYVDEQLLHESLMESMQV